MSVSSHLTPDPERRLRIIHEGISDSLKFTDGKLAVLSLAAILQAAAAGTLCPEGPLGRAAVFLFCASLPGAVLGLSPFIETRRPLPLLDPVPKSQMPDSLPDETDIAGHYQQEMVNFFDRYLGGGITATPYYEDIVARIVVGAKLAARKLRLLRISCALLLAAEACLLAAVLFR